jgi:hypothetical protein
MNSPDLSIVIVSYNVREYLKKCLNSIPAASGRLSGEIFVIDNASRDDSAGLIEREFPDVHLTVNFENVGMARAVNQVLAPARGRYVLLLNPDTVLPEGSLERLVAVADRWPEVGVTGPLIRDPLNGEPLFTFRPFPTWKDAFLLYTAAGWLLRRMSVAAWEPTFDSPSASGQLIGACFLIRRELLEKIGGLDPGYFLYYEDTEYCRRAIEAGWKVLHTREAEVFHHQGKSTEQEMPDWIWALHLKGLIRYLQTAKGAGHWFYATVFKALFLCKLLMQSLESMIKIPAYRATMHVEGAARHRRRLRRNAWVMGEFFRFRFFA